jgi:polysaccharide deacetylase family protein (PEP-CTERM system associated)
MLNALTFDVEDYFHVHAFEGLFPRSQWSDQPSRVVENTRRILQLLREFGTKATFFMLGWVARQHPEIVREIAADGHELASHGYEHASVFDLDAASFRHDLRLSIDAIRSACPDAKILGYRAPTFSIDERTPWAFDVLAELDLVYDSSISPASFHDRYGMPSANRFVHALPSGLLEIPLSTVRVLGCNWQVAGGGYFRLLPLPVTSWAIRKINGEGHAAVIYLHPWEFDPDQPRVNGATPKSQFRHYLNLHHTERRLRKLLSQYSFAPIREVFREQLCDYSSRNTAPQASRDT